MSVMIHAAAARTHGRPIPSLMPIAMAATLHTVKRTLTPGEAKSKATPAPRRKIDVQQAATLSFLCVRRR